MVRTGHYLVGTECYNSWFPNGYLVTHQNSRNYSSYLCNLRIYPVYNSSTTSCALALYWWRRFCQVILFVGGAIAFILVRWLRRRMLSRGYEAAPYRYAPETRRTRGSNKLGF